MAKGQRQRGDFTGTVLCVAPYSTETRDHRKEESSINVLRAVRSSRGHGGVEP